MQLFVKKPMTDYSAAEVGRADCFEYRHEDGEIELINRGDRSWAQGRLKLDDQRVIDIKDCKAVQRLRTIALKFRWCPEEADVFQECFARCVQEAAANEEAVAVDDQKDSGSKLMKHLLKDGLLTLDDEITTRQHPDRLASLMADGGIQDESGAYFASPTAFLQSQLCAACGSKRKTGCRHCKYLAAGASALKNVLVSGIALSEWRKGKMELHRQQAHQLELSVQQVYKMASEARAKLLRVERRKPLSHGFVE